MKNSGGNFPGLFLLHHKMDEKTNNYFLGDFT